MYKSIAGILLDVDFTKRLIKNGVELTKALPITAKQAEIIKKELAEVEPKPAKPETKEEITETKVKQTKPRK